MDGKITMPMSSKKDVDASLQGEYKKESSKTCDPATANAGLELDVNATNNSKCSH